MTDKVKDVQNIKPVMPGESFFKEHLFSRSEVIAFSLGVGDSNPLHHDVEFAHTTRFGGLIVSGTHSTALMLGATAAYFADRRSVLGVKFSVRFERHIPADQRVVIHWVVSSVESRQEGVDGQSVNLEGYMLLSDGTRCMSASGTVLVDADLERGASPPKS